MPGAIRTPVALRIRTAIEALSDALDDICDVALDDADTPDGLVRGLALQGLAFNTRRRLDGLKLAHGLTVAAPLPLAAE